MLPLALILAGLIALGILPFAILIAGPSAIVLAFLFLALVVLILLAFAGLLVLLAILAAFGLLFLLGLLSLLLFLLAWPVPLAAQSIPPLTCCGAGPAWPV